MFDYRKRIAATAAGATAALFAGQAMAGGLELTVVAGLAESNPLTMSFLQNFVTPLNKAGKGVLTVKYVGGPDVVPPNKGHAAVQRGQFDLLNCPVSYYIGAVPEGYAMLASNVPVSELRKNGGWELLNEAFNKKAGAQLVAWAEQGTPYNIYLTVKPKFDKDGVPDLSGTKMRTTGTYRPLFRALGASTIGMKASEIYTGLERGVVQGFGWPVTGVPGLGLHKLVKYRIQPPFYATNQSTTMNLAKWKALTKAQKDVLMKAVADYEKTSPPFMQTWVDKDDAVLKKAGVEEIVLKGKAADKYLSIAYEEIWKQLAERSEYSDKLRAKLYRAPSS